MLLLTPKFSHPPSYYSLQQWVQQWNYYPFQLNRLYLGKQEKNEWWLHKRTDFKKSLPILGNQDRLSAGARIKRETFKIEIAILTINLYTQSLCPGKQFYITCIALFHGTCNCYKSFILCVYQNRHICQCVAWSRHHLHILINDEWFTWC